MISLQNPETPPASCGSTNIECEIVKADDKVKSKMKNHIAVRISVINFWLHFLCGETSHTQKKREDFAELAMKLQGWKLPSSLLPLFTFLSKESRRMRWRKWLSKRTQTNKCRSGKFRQQPTSVRVRHGYEEPREKWFRDWKDVLVRNFYNRSNKFSLECRKEKQLHQ